MGVIGQIHAPVSLAPEKGAPNTRSIGGWVGPRVVWTFRGTENLLILPRIKPCIVRPVVWSLLILLFSLILCIFRMLTSLILCILCPV